MPGKSGAPENAGHGLGLNHAGKGSLRRRIALSENVGLGRNNAAQGILGRSEMAAIVEVDRVESWPELAAQLPTGGKACDVGRRGVFCSTPGPEPTSSNAEGCQAPVALRKVAPYQLTHGRANITVRSPKAILLGVRDHRAT